MSERRSRPRRRTTSRRSRNMPSAVHYVGYVEDEETPEMIMKKFEALERIQKQQEEKQLTERMDEMEDNRGNEGIDVMEDVSRRETRRSKRKEAVDVEATNGEETPSAQEDETRVLTEEQLKLIFRETSMFNIESAMKRGGWTWGEKRKIYLGVDGSDEECLTFYDSEDEDEEFWTGKPSRKRGSGRVKVKQMGPPKTHKLITTLNRENGAFIRRKVQVIDPNAIITVKMPQAPLPLSWGRTIAAYRPKQTRQRNQQVLRDNILSGNVAKKLGRSFLGVLINPGWEEEALKLCGREEASPQLLERLDLPSLCPSGFVFIWVNKRLISGVMELMYGWNYCYVENLAWVQLRPNNQTVQDSYDGFRRSHLTLFIFRRENEGKDIDLRHQRSPDVVVDFLRGSLGGNAHTPQETYTTIETLLPDWKDNLLELWAFPSLAREGWMQVSSKK